MLSTGLAFSLCENPKYPGAVCGRVDGLISLVAIEACLTIESKSRGDGQP